MVTLAIAGCGSDSSSGSQSPTTPNRAHPVGIIAIGHSGLTGENSDPARPGQPTPQNSWATGTSPSVESVYMRLVAAVPETRDHVANSAVGGAPVTALADQARSALELVPSPALTIVQTIDGDIRCDGTDPDNVVSFGATLTDVLKSLTTSSPDTKILLVGQLGRPSPAFVAHLVAVHPDVKPSLTGFGICDFYDQRGKLNTASFTRLTRIIDAYEGEQARVCSSFANCRTDDGVRAAYQDTLANFTPDWNHLNVRGQAQEAKVIWPAVAQLLGLPR